MRPTSRPTPASRPTRFPGFLGKPGSYPIEVEFAPPEPQNRWKTGFRLVLAIPALILNTALSGGSSGGGGRSGSGGGSVGLLWSSAFLGWFAALFTGRMPEQLRDANLYALRYGVQTGSYLLLLTERYPDADPESPPTPAGLRPHPITVSAEEDLRRSRLTVFFRLLLAIPHFVWLALWSIVAIFAVIGSWFVTLFRGTAPDSLHRFLARVRALLDARLRLRPPGHQPVPRLHRPRGAIRSTCSSRRPSARTAGRPAFAWYWPSRP